MQSTPSLLLLSGPLWPDRVLFLGQIELFDYLNCVQTNDLCGIELLEMELFDHSTVCI